MERAMALLQTLVDEQEGFASNRPNREPGEFWPIACGFNRGG